MTSGLFKYASNTIWLFAEQILRIMSGLLVGVWVARHLGPDQFGALTYAIVYVNMFHGLVNLGFDALVVKYLVEKRDTQATILGTSFWCKLLGAVILIFCVNGIAMLGASDKENLLLVFFVSISVLFLPFEVIEYNFHAFVQSKFVSISKTLQLLLSITLKAICIYQNAPLWVFALIVTVDQITLASGLFIAYKVSGNPMFFQRFDKSLASTLLREGFPLTLSSTASMIYTRFDQLLIHSLLGQSFLGVYSAAIKISEAFYFIPMVICNSLFPAVINAKKLSSTQYQHRIRALYSLMVWGSSLFILPIAYFSLPLIQFLYTEEYLAAAGILQIHIFTLLSVSLGVASGKWLLAEGYYNMCFLRTVWGAVVNIVLNLILIPHYGMYGAVGATLVSSFIAGIFFDFFPKSTRPCFYTKIQSFWPFWKNQGFGQ